MADNPKGVVHNDEEHDSDEFPMMNSHAKDGSQRYHDYSADSNDEDLLSLEVGGDSISQRFSDSSDESDNDAEQSFKRRPRNDWSSDPVDPKKKNAGRKINGQQRQHDSHALASTSTTTTTSSSSLPPASITATTSTPLPKPQATVSSSPSPSCSCNHSCVPSHPKAPFTQKPSPKSPPPYERPHTRSSKHKKAWQRSVRSKIKRWLKLDNLPQVFSQLKALIPSREQHATVEWGLLYTVGFSIENNKPAYLQHLFRFLRTECLSLGDALWTSLVVRCCTSDEGALLHSHVKDFLRRVVLLLAKHKGTRLGTEAVLLLLDAFTDGEFSLGGPTRSNAHSLVSPPGVKTELSREVEDIPSMLQTYSAAPAMVMKKEEEERGLSMDEEVQGNVDSYVREDCWGRLREVLTYRGCKRGEERAMVSCMFKALCAQGCEAGNKFRSFVCMVTMNGKHDLPPKLLELLCQIGSSLVVEFHARRMCDVAFSITKTFCDYDISYFSQESFEASIADAVAGGIDTASSPRSLLPSITTLVLAMLDCCLDESVKKPQVALDIMKECDWIYPKAGGHTVDQQTRKSFLWKRFHVLTRLAGGLLDERLLPDGCSVLMKALYSLLHDLECPMPEENVSKGVNNLYNDYVEILVNSPKYLKQLQPLLHLHYQLQGLLTFDACVLRGLVAVMTKDGYDLATAKTLFLEGCQRGIYSIPEIPKDATPTFSLPIPNYCVAEEIFHLIREFLDRLVPVIKEARFPLHQHLQVALYVVEQVSPDIGCVRILKIVDMSLEATTNRIQAAASSLVPPLILSRDLPRLRLMVQHQSLENYLKQCYNVTLPPPLQSFSVGLLQKPVDPIPMFPPAAHSSQQKPTLAYHAQSSPKSEFRSQSHKPALLPTPKLPLEPAATVPSSPEDSTRNPGLSPLLPKPRALLPTPTSSLDASSDKKPTFWHEPRNMGAAPTASVEQKFSSIQRFKFGTPLLKTSTLWSKRASPYSVPRRGASRKGTSSDFEPKKKFRGLIESKEEKTPSSSSTFRKKDRQCHENSDTIVVSITQASSSSESSRPSKEDQDAEKDKPASEIASDAVKDKPTPCDQSTDVPATETTPSGNSNDTHCSQPVASEAATSAGQSSGNGKSATTSVGKKRHLKRFSVGVSANGKRIIKRTKVNKSPSPKKVAVGNVPKAMTTPSGGSEVASTTGTKVTDPLAGVPSSLVQNDANIRISMFLKSRILSKHKGKMGDAQIEECVAKLREKFKQLEFVDKGLPVPQTLQKSDMKRLIEFAKQHV